MRELIKARIMCARNDLAGLELHDGKELYVSPFDNVITPAMIDTVRPVLLESIVGRVEKLERPAYGIYPYVDKDGRKYTIMGRVLDINDRIKIIDAGEQMITLDTGYGVMAILAVGKAIGAMGTGDYIKISDEDKIFLNQLC